MSKYRKFTTICCAAVLALGLAACGSSSDDDTAGTTPPVVTPDPEPDPIDVERKAINDAIDAASAAAQMVTDTASAEDVTAADDAVAAARKAIDDATRITAGDVSEYRTSLATIRGQLTAAKNSRTMTRNLATQRGAISDAIALATNAVGAVVVDSDPATVTAAEEAITAAEAAIDAAGDILASEADAERAKVAGLQKDLGEATASRQTAMDAADKKKQQRLAMEARRTEQLKAINTALDAARAAVAAVNDGSTEAVVQAAKDAVASVRAKIADAADVSDEMKATPTESVGAIETSLGNAETRWQTAQAASQELANQRKDISDAIDTARTVVAAVNEDSTDAQVEAATQAISDARVAIAGTADVPAEENDRNTELVGEIETRLGIAKGRRTAARKIKDDKQKTVDVALAARAAKLYEGIGKTGAGDAGAAAYTTGATTR